MGLALAAPGMLLTPANAKIVASKAGISLFIGNLHYHFLQFVRKLTVCENSKKNGKLRLISKRVRLFPAEN